MFYLGISRIFESHFLTVLKHKLVELLINVFLIRLFIQTFQSIRLFISVILHHIWINNGFFVSFRFFFIIFCFLISPQYILCILNKIFLHSIKNVFTKNFFCYIFQLNDLLLFKMQWIYIFGDFTLLFHKLAEIYITHWKKHYYAVTYNP